MSCFDFNVTCWFCGKDTACDYCKRVSGEEIPEEQDEIIFEWEEDNEKDL